MNVYFVFQHAPVSTSPLLPASSPLAQPGSVGGMGSGASLGSLGPNNGVGVPPSSTPSQSISLSHCPSVRQSSPSPARSRTPTPHLTPPPSLPGSQTPQPHTPSLPHVSLGAGQQQLPQPANADKAMQLQQPLGGPPSTPNTGLVPQHPPTPVSFFTLPQYRLSAFLSWWCQFCISNDYYIFLFLLLLISCLRRALCQ